MTAYATERLYRGLRDETLLGLLQAFRIDRARERADADSVAFIDGRIELIKRELRTRGVSTNEGANNEA